MKQCKIYFLGIFFLIATALNGQELEYDDFIKIVKNNHPIAQKADLLIPKGEQTIRSAKGGFDPQLYTTFNQKEFDKKSYYRNLDAAVKIPTNFGLEFKAGYENNQGIYVNSENTVPTAGLAYAGFSMPVLQGLMIDERRTALQQANIFASMTEVERRKLMNDLIFEATVAYWEWVKAGNEVNIQRQAVELAKIRLEAVKITFEQGDNPAIDTLEAFIQWQDRQVNLSKSFVDFQKKTFELTNFLWDENQQPLQLQSSITTPDLFALLEKNIPIDSTTEHIRALPTIHPDLLLYDLKLRNLEVDRRWKQEKLKPKLNIKYNFIAEPIGGDDAAALSLNNYKWGLEFKMPIPMRTARADLQLNNIKIQETQLSRSEKLLAIQNKAQYYQMQLQNLQDQIRLSENNIENYKRLLNAERRKFDIGEGSLFYVNTRENKLINAQMKLMDLKAKYQEMVTALDWSLGRLE